MTRCEAIVRLLARGPLKWWRPEHDPDVGTLAASGRVRFEAATPTSPWGLVELD